MSSRFVRPDTTVLKISQGDTLTVKRRLNSGEERDLFSRIYLAGADGQLKVNPFQHGIGLVTAYLLDWSLTDDDGKRVAIEGLSVEALTQVINGLDPMSYGEIRRAVEEHDAAMRAERGDLKNGQDGEKGSPAISPSLSAVAGDTNGFVN